MNKLQTAAPASAPAVDETAVVSAWLDDFERALVAGDVDALSALFLPDSHWRDLLPFTWHLTPHRGAQEIANALVTAQPTTKARGFAIATGRTPPRWRRRTDHDVIEAFFEFETELGRGSGVLRLAAESDGSALRAWVLLTTLDELKGFEEPIGARRPQGHAYSRSFGGENWLDRRTREQTYDDREPAALVIGAGQAGLSVAARLRRLGVDTLIVERNERVGDNWRKRYHSLALHNGIDANHLPYMPFPPTWPFYIPKDMLGDWFEYYAGAMELNVWTGTTFLRGSYDETAKCWSATVLKPDGTERVLRPRHLIFANGVSGIPYVPELTGLEEFAGEVTHSHGFTDGSAWRGKRALVIGTGNSGHDIAQDLHGHGVETTIVQRGPTTVVSVEPSARLNYAIFDEGMSLDDTDLILATATMPLRARGWQLVVERMKEFDKDLHAGLEARGFKLDWGDDDTGHQMKYRQRGGGYYLDCGCSGLIIDGEVGLLQFDRIERFVAEGALLTDGTVVPADLIVLATGYYTQLELVRRVLGDDIADRIGPVWGIDEDGELGNMWKRTAQDGLWFMAGGLPDCRIYSKHLALLIKAREEGLIGGLASAGAS